MNAHVEGRERGAALRKMSRRQVWACLGALYAAWKHSHPAVGAQSAEGKAGSVPLLSEVMDNDQHPFHAWRHETCGRLSEARNEDYSEIMAFAFRAQGRDAEADALTVKNLAAPRQRALDALNKAVEAADRAARLVRVQFDAYAYADGFMRNKRGVSLADADDRALWHASYLLQRKARLLVKKAEVPF